MAVALLSNDFLSNDLSPSNSGVLPIPSSLENQIWARMRFGSYTTPSPNIPPPVPICNPNDIFPEIEILPTQNDTLRHPWRESLVVRVWGRGLVVPQYTLAQKLMVSWKLKPEPQLLTVDTSLQFGGKRQKHLFAGVGAFEFCFWCGKNGHSSSVCKFAPSSSPTNLSLTSVKSEPTQEWVTVRAKKKKFPISVKSHTDSYHGGGMLHKLGKDISNSNNGAPNGLVSKGPNSLSQRAQANSQALSTSPTSQIHVNKEVDLVLNLCNVSDLVVGGSRTDSVLHQGKEISQ
ncbi:uncharacterized protein G2W53_021755 [Senna tora]|uniref:Uncharacterized protein n=1 Tax=Senna tora TaxID=362788 RepID=A0A834WLE7_9FABA|nr:uncharacterized protein G2W53_021755 [Senna tora]